ncbi:hypothetical protein P153DRAFT_189132 [Dothidotthia symphoricarpi CBS 119687]|uniref:F-box domain-containing protein n=1 Tax=Dothidotthia symphoricarpi CBS 119687 TaxID=1392245 RepID=A0A6A6AKI6_9PLEO|nr:uncharacterized protein P153DRAFT_189132 [Dothidotthia symphoricarpi CBS 119687]KAF2132330.1 hypothetical protein P153DRAFT_189132 [Dothidotthia symphoricarpi CBS 119687]
MHIYRCLENLPNELLQLIVSFLSTPTLKSTALVCRTLNRCATSVLWQNVCLVDERRLHVKEGPVGSWEERGPYASDEHDDTPIIQKLYILATNPTIAAKVQTLTHRCHLPTPNIFNELPRTYFHGENLSQDDRLHILLRLAIRNLVNVHTLRLIYGHWRLTSALIIGFLDQNRPRRMPLRKLWLESCTFSISTMQFLLPACATGLESIRIRRMREEAIGTTQRKGMDFMDFKLSRGGQPYQMHNGAGGWVETTLRFAEKGLPERWHHPNGPELKAKAAKLDAAIWATLPDIRDFVDAYQSEVDDIRVSSPTVEPTRWLLGCSASTLTSLNLDWILWRRSENDSFDNTKNVLNALSRMRFPSLRAFQIRNAVMPLTKLPDDVFLLEDTFLTFLEAHPKLQCLGWPLDKIYSHVKPSVETQSRAQRLIAHLATVLTDLRLDTCYVGHGEPLTDEGRTTEQRQERIRRRRFIADFAPHMRRLQQIKLEGGIPRDEKREILRALHWCPLKKIVLIGVSFPAGNTWGDKGRELKELDPGQSSDTVYNLEEEDLDAILEAYRNGFTVSEDHNNFEPDYDGPSRAPLLQNIALHHAATVEELKICGYNGCPILSQQTAITRPLLAPLRHFANLRQLVVSFWLLTWFENAYRDSEIIGSWHDTRSPSSTALVVVTPPTSPSREHPVDPGHMPQFNPTVVPRQHFNRWSVALKTRFSPSALAYRVAHDIAPYLSPVAKARPGGVRVRASFCLGATEERRVAKDIFDLDIRIGADDQVLEYVGPREEGEKGRCWAKLEERRWF